MRYSFAAPSVAAKRACELALVSRREHAERELPYRGERFSYDSRSTEKHTVSDCELSLDVRGVSSYHVVHADFYVFIFATVPYTLCDFLSHLRSIAVSAYVRDDNELLSLCIARIRSVCAAPFSVYFHQFRYLCVEYRAVACAYHVDIKILYAVERVYHERVFKRSDYVVKVILCRAHIAFFVCNSASEYALMAIVRTE